MNKGSTFFGRDLSSSGRNLLLFQNMEFSMVFFEKRAWKLFSLSCKYRGYTYNKNIFYKMRNMNEINSKIWNLKDE